MRSVPLPFLSKITLLWTRAREPGPVSPVKVDSPLPFPWTQRGEIYNQAEYQKRYDGLVSRFDKANARHTEITDLIAERMARKHQIESYLKELRSREPLTEFRETDWLAMVDYIAVHSKNDIRVTFKDGTEIKA